MIAAKANDRWRLGPCKDYFQAQLTSTPKSCLDMAVRPGALDDQVFMEMSNGCTTLEDGSKVRDDFGRELGEISDGFLRILVPSRCACRRRMAVRPNWLVMVSIL